MEVDKRARYYGCVDFSTAPDVYFCYYCGAHLDKEGQLFCENKTCRARFEADYPKGTLELFARLESPDDFWKSKSLPVGCFNPSNHCFANAAMTLLLSLPAFAIQCVRDPGASEVSKRLEWMAKESSRGFTLNVRPLLWALPADSKGKFRFRSGQQDDSREFISQVLEGAKEVSDLFEIEFEQTIICEKNHKSASLQRNTMFMLDNFGADISTSAKEQMSAHSMSDYACEQCGKKVRAVRTMEIKKFPPLLIVSLRRWEGTEKVNETIVALENRLLLGTRRYQKRAVVWHTVGTLKGGHYTATVYSENEFVSVNDAAASVTAAHANEKAAGISYLVAYVGE